MLRGLASALLAMLLCAAAFAAAKPNIVLITMDSVPADFVGSKLTPGLDSAEGVYFQQAYAQEPLTVVSHATILTGMYPQAHKVTQFANPLAPSLPFLSDILHSQGYRTAAFVGSIELDPKNGLAPGFDRGFEVYDAGFHQPQSGQSRFQTIQRRAVVVVTRAKAWIARNKTGPFFVWVELHDAHVASRAAFNSGVSASDAAATSLIAYLREQTLYDNALVVIASDHGQSWGAHGEQGHGVFLYNETVHVPLLVKWPGAQPAVKTVKSRVSLVDVAPSILEIVGIPIPSQMQGQSLVRAVKGGADEPAYSRTEFPYRAFGWSPLQSWRAGKYLYIHSPKPELYDLSADRDATHNLAQTSKAILNTMASQLTAFDQRLSQGANANAGLSSSEVQKLASLGYVGLQKSAAGSATVSGTDPKDEISTANKIMAAVEFWEDGKPDRAIAAAQALGSSASNVYLAQFVMGTALAGEQEYSKAIAALHRAIELQPDSSWAHYYMGLSLAKTGDYKTAAVHLEIAVSRLTGFADGHALLADVYDHLGRRDDAKRERGKAGSKT